MSGTSKTPKIMTWGFCGPYTSAKRSLTARAHHSHASGQQGARSFTHLQAPERGQSVCAAHMEMDQARGLDALDRQAASSSSPPALPQAHDMHQRRHPHTFHSVCAHSAITACAGATGDRKASPRSSTPCWRLPLSSCHALTRGITRLTKLPRQAADARRPGLNEMPESSLAQAPHR